MNDYTPALYCDVAALLADGTPEAPLPTVGTRTDGRGLLYSSAVNVMFGPPESGKTLAASCIAAEVLFVGDSVLVIDIDHNGPCATVARFRSLGVSVEVLSDPERFRYCSPEDAEQVRAVVDEARAWAPTLTILDSLGELMPMFGANSNDADDFTRVNRATLTALANSGSAVLAIDHEAKSTTSIGYGSSGTAAKKRAVDGVMLRFKAKAPFTPGWGGKAALTIVKDRHGGLRAVSPAGDQEPLAALFQLIQKGDALDWRFSAPAGDQPSEGVEADAAALDKLTPPPTSTRDVQARMKWGPHRAGPAIKMWRELSATRYSAAPALSVLPDSDVATLTGPVVTGPERYPVAPVAPG